MSWRRVLHHTQFEADSDTRLVSSRKINDSTKDIWYESWHLRPTSTTKLRQSRLIMLSHHIIVHV